MKWQREAKDTIQRVDEHGATQDDEDGANAARAQRLATRVSSAAELTPDAGELSVDGAVKEIRARVRPPGPLEAAVI